MARITKPYFVPKFKPLQSQTQCLLFAQKILRIFHFTCSSYEVVWLTRFLNFKAMKSPAEHKDGRAALHLQPGLPEPAATWAPASTGHWPPCPLGTSPASGSSCTAAPWQRTPGRQGYLFALLSWFYCSFYCLPVAFPFRDGFTHFHHPGKRWGRIWGREDKWW